ncbi:hypothetical protein [Planococcus halocryophilus]|uniref:Uncharacterized protein n=1 Tax=Planococcus halocryophilus TaxID=1215089 RepID=A0A1C7DPC8_9BACL|nr:hypothetical protein [Planococcus halocryophilus]ANU13336.1 hypothetical protein BBI08_05570 [Planococcus halocryophilus]
MLLNYLKSSSASVLSSVFTFLVLAILFSPDFGLDDVPSEFYRYTFTATLFGYIGGLIAIWILWLYQDKEVFTKDKIAIFAAGGLLIGIGLELLTGFIGLPYFLISALVGALMFLVMQKLNNKLLGWSIVAVHFGLLFIYPQVIDFFTFI